MSDRNASRVLVVSVVALVLIVVALMFRQEATVNKVNTVPEIVRSFKVGDEPSIHRVWKVVVDGEEIKYVEIVNDWR